MAIAVATTRQALANTYAGLGRWISLHTADPGSTGASEASGGSYARAQTTWTASTGGVSNGSQVTINVAAGTYSYAGIWDSSSAGNFIDKIAITSTTLGAAGQILITPSYTQT